MTIPLHTNRKIIGQFDQFTLNHFVWQQSKEQMNFFTKSDHMDRHAISTAKPHQWSESMSASMATTSPGLEPYEGEWTYQDAAHLLRRSMYGPTHQQIQSAVDLGLEGTLAMLLEEKPLPDPPVNSYYQSDASVPVGSTWVDAPYDGTQEVRRYRRFSLSAWTIGTMMQEGVSLREKMTLFWHNHFAIGGVNDPKFIYRYVRTLRMQALGNLKELIKAITIDPAMLRFLNGNQNTKSAPNENFARELLELYTVGKGPLAGPGDYTTFTEQDVAETAKILTGWRDTGFYSTSADRQVGSIFRAGQHDTTTKQLSQRLGGAVINNGGAQEYEHLIDLIFEQRNTALHICRKLYRWFVYYKIEESTEANVVEAMAEILIQNNFELKPVVEALLRSAHFFHITSIGPMIKNPLDFMFDVVKTFQVDLPPRLNAQYTIWASLYRYVQLMEIEYYLPPSVAGWKAYYQEPQYYRTWINAATLNARAEFSDLMATVGFPYGNQRLAIDALKFLASITGVDDPNTLVREVGQIIFPQPLTDGQYDQLKEILVPGLPDYEWTIEYGQYKQNPQDSDLAASIESRIRLLLQQMFNMAEFQLS